MSTAYLSLPGRVPVGREADECGYHPLRLHPGEGQAQNPKKPVVSEYYDEIIFNEPTEAFYQLLTHPRYIQPHRFAEHCTSLQNARELSGDSHACCSHRFQRAGRTEETAVSAQESKGRDSAAAGAARKNGRRGEAAAGRPLSRCYVNNRIPVQHPYNLPHIFMSVELKKKKQAVDIITALYRRSELNVMVH